MVDLEDALVEGTAFSIEEESFDASLLPRYSRISGTAVFHRAVTDSFMKSYASIGGQLSVVFAEGRIAADWEPQAGQVPASATITKLLQAGRYDDAIPLLRTRLQLEPDHVESLYNLGMVYSDRLQLSEARELLGRAVALDPGDANAQVALGIAALRDNDPAAALAPLQKAVVLEPRNPFALRTLGQLLLMQDNAAAARPHLQAAATVAPQDPINLFTYAQCLLGIDGEANEAEADALFQRALTLAPVGDLAEKIKQQQRRLADRVMRANAKGLPRMDAVLYLSNALEAYRSLDREGQKQLLAEVAAVGQKGLAINEPGTSRSLKTLPGTWSDLALACLIHVGMKRLMPDEDSGLGVGAEYEEAVRLQGS